MKCPGRDKIFIEQFVTKQFKSHRDGILISLVNGAQIRTEPKIIMIFRHCFCEDIVYSRTKIELANGD